MSRVYKGILITVTELENAWRVTFSHTEDILELAKSAWQTIDAVISYCIRDEIDNDISGMKTGCYIWNSDLFI